MSILRFWRSAGTLSMRDWPAGLKLNAVAAELAPILYASHRKACGFPIGHWVELSAAERQQWIARAAHAIRGVK